MLAALTSAWQNSIKADRDFAHWAQDEISGGPADLVPQAGRRVVVAVLDHLPGQAAVTRR